MLNKIRKLKEKKGFTLVELIVVIAIIAILTAVLVPLINNWTQQAAYTTLNDSAQTVSNTVNESISKVIAGGAPLSSTVNHVKGVKAAAGSNKLFITLGSVTSNAEGKKDDTNNNSAADQKTVEYKIAVEIAKALDATMPNNCAFIASIKNGAVTGVVYQTTNGTAPTVDANGEVDPDIKKVKNFDGFEMAGADANASRTTVGVTGIYKTDTEW